MKRILCLMLVLSSISVFSQKEIKVVSFKQSTTDISARTNQREDPKGDICALIKVQMPIRNALFDGNIIGEVNHKLNEYWIYMPQQSSKLEVRLSGFKPFNIDFRTYGIDSLESKGTYELCIVENSEDSPQLYNDGMIALAKNDYIIAFEKLEKASDLGYAPAAFALGQVYLMDYDDATISSPNTTESYQEAYNHFKKAVEGGYSDAQFALAELLKYYKLEIAQAEAHDEIYFESIKGQGITGIKIDSTMDVDNYIKSLIEKAANAGNIDAQYRMISDDKWCEENATKGIAIAEFGMGIRHDKELSIHEYPMLEEIEISRNENFDIAFDWYQKAANHGLDVSQWRLGEMYALGLGCEKNIDMAIEWRTKAAEQGNCLFQLMMGVMYCFGVFSDFGTYSYPDDFNYYIELTHYQDLEKADYWLRKLGHQKLSRDEVSRISPNDGYAECLDCLASKLIDDEQYDKAIYWYQRMAEMGYCDALCGLGKMYFEGIGINKDYQKARKLFESAILDDEIGRYVHVKDNALCYLGVIYRDGLGVEADRFKAFDYLMRSTHNGFVRSFYELGNLYFAENKYEKALKFYREARSKSGDVIQGGKYVRLNEHSTKACYKLGQMYNNGLGVEKNTDKAVEYMTEAASRGSDEAKKYLQERNLPIPSPKLGSNAND